MKRANDKISFIQKAESKHGKRFDYQKFEYVSAKTKGTIVCPIHGDYEQTPDKHLQSKHGCARCAQESSRNLKKGKLPKNIIPSISENEYRQRVMEKYGERFELDFSEYKGWTLGFIIIRCSEHGISKYVPQAFLSSRYGCRECWESNRISSKTKSYENFLKKAEIIHEHKYRYSNSNETTYENRKSIITIICPKHGEFQKKAQKHLAGQGCFDCKIDSLVESGALPGGYHDIIFQRNPDLKDKQGYVYYLKIGSVYKIGITINIRQRIKSLRSLSKEPVKILQTYSCSLYEAYLIEQLILKDFETSRIKLDWSTELFAHHILEGQELSKFAERIPTSTSLIK